MTEMDPGKIEYGLRIEGDYVYEKPVDIDNFVLQKEEVDEVEWFDIDEVREGCIHRDGTFCVPMEGLQTLMKYLGENQ